MDTLWTFLCNAFAATYTVLAVLLLLAFCLGLMGCDNNYQPTCTNNCIAGGGDDSFGAGAINQGKD